MAIPRHAAAAWWRAKKVASSPSAREGVDTVSGYQHQQIEFAAEGHRKGLAVIGGIAAAAVAAAAAATRSSATGHFHGDIWIVRYRQGGIDRSRLVGEKLNAELIVGTVGYNQGQGGLVGVLRMVRTDGIIGDIRSLIHMRVSARRRLAARRLDLRVGHVSGFTVQRGQSGATVYRSLYFSADRRADCTGCGVPGCRCGGSPLRCELGPLSALAAGRNHSRRYRDLAAAICSYCPATPAGNTSLRRWRGRRADPRMVRGGAGPAVVV